MKYCRNCRYIRKTKEMWCKCTGYSVKPNDTCDKWEKLMKKCDICGKEFENSGIIFAKKKDGADLLLCPDCAERVCNEMEKALLEGAEYTGNSQEKHTF